MRKDFIAREMSMEIAVGIFMVMVFLGLGYFTIILSRETWFSEKYPLEVAFDEVMGLRDGDSVVVRGMPVGKVKSLALTNEHVRVVALLDESVTIREGYRIKVVATSVLGGRYLVIDEGDPGGKALPSDLIFRGEPPIDFMDDAAELVSGLKKGLLEDGIVEDLKSATSQLREIAERLSAGKGTLGRLLSDDETMYEDLSGSLASLRAVAERLEKGEGTLGRLLSSDDQLYEDLSATVTSLRNITEKVEKGEGSMGKLLQDDSLFEEVDSLMGEIRASIDDYRETAPVVTFTSVFFGAF